MKFVNYCKLIRFQVGRLGKHEMWVHLMCDSYIGVDQKISVSFNSLSEEQVIIIRILNV